MHCTKATANRLDSQHPYAVARKGVMPEDLNSGSNPPMLWTSKECGDRGTAASAGSWPMRAGSAA